MSKELAERLERWLAMSGMSYGPSGDTVREAIAALRSEPVAWGYCPECGRAEVRHEEGSHKQCAHCKQEWFSDINYSDVVQINLARHFDAAPSRETAKPEGAQLGEHPDKKNLPLVNQYGKPVAEPALSAEQILAQYDQEIKRGGSTDSIIVRTVQHFTALSSLTARGEGIEAAAKAAHESLRDIDRAHAEIAYSAASALKGASHD